MWKDILNYDKELLIAINQTGNVSYDAFWLTITNAWNWIPFFLGILLVNFYFFPKKIAWRIFFYTLAVLFSTVLITNITKEIIARPRPINTPEIIPYLRVLLTQDGYSFFSGHTSNSFAICTFLFLVFRQKLKFSSWVFLWAIPYAYSRMYLGVHFPSDILVGFLVGITIATIGYYIFKKSYSLE
ncbi:MAG: phosphatase PAP2 family protein [Capnocytophaga sp.]|nr:phosphatase PAP2 family protein [Capnocytophaga sp.]